MDSKRFFNTSGPNNPTQHYTIPRIPILKKGIHLVKNERYFTIWAPRQTGKSTFFRLMAVELEKEGYKVCHINFENYKNADIQSFLNRLSDNILEKWDTNFCNLPLADIFNQIEKIKSQKLVLIIDEVEGINPDYFSDFLHAIRNAYHSRQNHSLKSVVLVGVSNITGIVQDNASPFNIADELDVPYFTDEETKELLEQHTAETGQRFAPEVIAKISEITANQPGLVNGFAKVLVDRNPDKPTIELSDYLKVEEWYLTEAIDKNISNVINKANKYRKFVEGLLFSEKEILYKIGHPAIKELYTVGLVKKGKSGNVEFWVPLYKKRLFDEFYPYTNGEGNRIAGNMLSTAYLTPDNKINFDKLLDSYKEYIKLRSFRPFRKKNKKGKFISTPEAAMVYSFETYINIFLRELDGKCYREAYISLGNTDLLINVMGFEYLLEIKKYYSPSYFAKGKKQLAYYCSRAGLDKGYYVVFIPNTINPSYISEKPEVFNGVEIITYLIHYDEERDV